MIRGLEKTAGAKADPFDIWLATVKQHAGAKWPALAVFALSLAIFIPCVAPAVSFHDSGEFSLALHSAGIPHPPGAPTWMVLSSLLKACLPGLEASRIANLFSALCGSITLSLLYIFVYRACLSFPLQSRHLAAATSVLGMVGCGAFLEQSFVAEQYTLLTALLLGNLLAVQSFVAKPTAWKPVALGVLWALACGNHPSQVVLGILMLIAVVQVRKSFSMLKSVPLGILGFVLGATVFVWLPLRDAANPIISWGHPGTLQQFVWCITRGQWESRPISQAPAGMLPEWIKSYDVLGQMGPVAVVLALAGFISFKNEDKKILWWTLAAAIPYGLVLFVGHLRQELMDLLYIRHYGVIDWHLPIYLMIAILGGIGVAKVSSLLDNKGWAMFAGLNVVLLAGGVRQLSTQSLGDFNAPKEYVDGHLASLPKDAIVVAFSDDLSQMMAYTRYGKGMRQDLYAGFGMPQQRIATNGFVWNENEKVAYMQSDFLSPKNQPLNLPKLTREEILRRPLFTEYTSNVPQAAKYLKPSGWLFELCTQPVSDSEVRLANEQDQKFNPDLYKEPVGPQHRLSKEAFTLTHQRRGLYFLERKMYDLAEKSFNLALSWDDQNAQTYFGLAYVKESRMDYEGAAKLYEKAMEILPDFPGPRQNLALLYGLAGDVPLARELAKKELSLQRTEAAKQNTLNLLKTLDRLEIQHQKQKK